MRASLLQPTRRQIGRICEACSQQGQLRPVAAAASTTPNSAAPVGRRSAATVSRPRIQGGAIASVVQRRTIKTGEAASSSSSPPSSADKTEEEGGAASSPGAAPQSHYDFFPQTLPDGPPPAGSFDIDLRALRREFLQLQAKAHPDLHPAAHKARAEATSARINEAYRTLAAPLPRAQYLLAHLHGRDVGGDETARVEDPALLMDVLEARELIEEADDEGELAPLRAVNDGREEASVRELARCFREGDVDGAARECVRLRYWRNIAESIHNWERGKPIVLEH